MNPRHAMRSRPSAARGAAGVLACMFAGGHLGAQIEEPATGAADIEARLQSLTLARDAQMIADDFSGALTSAEVLVAELENTGDERLAGHIIKLADVQTQLGELETAEANYLRGVELLEQRDGELALSLVEPHQGLARSYIRGGRHEEAITVLEHAQDLSQRNLGLFNVEQATLLDDMTRAYLEVGDTRAAQRIQLDRLNIALRRFGEEDPQVIPFRIQLGQYYELSRMRGRAREQYEEILAVQEASFDEHDESLLFPLRKLALMDLARNDSSQARDRIIEVLESGEDITPLERALSLTTLGDWDMVHEDTESALDYYRQAYAAVRADPVLNPDELFDKPAIINFVAPLGPVDVRRRQAPYTWGSITLAFLVATDGRASEVEIVSAQPAGLMDAGYIGRIRQSYFRPRLLDGEPVATRNVQFSHQFRYYLPEEEE